MVYLALSSIVTVTVTTFIMNIQPIQPQNTPRILQGCPRRSGSCLDHCQRNRGSSKLKTATFEWPCGLVTWRTQALYIIYYDISCIVYYIFYSIFLYYVICFLKYIMYFILCHVYVIIYICVCVWCTTCAKDAKGPFKVRYPRRSSLRQGQLKASTDLADRGCMSTTLRRLSPEPLEVPGLVMTNKKLLKMAIYKYL